MRVRSSSNKAARHRNIAISHGFHVNFTRIYMIFIEFQSIFIDFHLTFHRGFPSFLATLRSRMAWKCQVRLQFWPSAPPWACPWPAGPAAGAGRREGPRLSGNRRAAAA